MARIAVDINHASSHLIRIYHRGFSRGIFISASEYTQPAINVCVEALQRTIVTLCTVEEIVRLLEEERDLSDFLKEKFAWRRLKKTRTRSSCSLRKATQLEAWTNLPNE